MKRANKKSLITQYINGNPEATVADIAKKFKTGRAYSLPSQERDEKENHS
jgi:hypothetical protein